MVEDRYKDAVRLVNHRAGDAFRAAFAYTAEAWRPLYLREDVATPALEAVVDDLMQRVRDSRPLATADRYGTIGPVEATVELHEEAVLLLFREDDTSGLVVSLDRDVAQGLGQFVKRCTAVLEEGVRGV